MKTYSPKILITGAHGQVGTALCHHPYAAHHQIIACSRHQLDITDHASIQQVMAQYHPDVVINTAAYTAVDHAEHEIALAMQVNHAGVEALAIQCSKRSIPLIHLSTDYVFDGKKNSPYVEDDAVNPLNVYGKSKWLGEESIRHYCKKHIILRVSAIFSLHRKNFVKTILQLAREKNELRIVADQITCPTYASTIAGTIFTIIETMGQAPSFGTYHYCQPPAISWYEFASAIIHQAAPYSSFSIKEIKAVPTSAYPTAAKRPAHSVLDCNKIIRDYDIKPSSWVEHLQGVIHEYLSTT